MKNKTLGKIVVQTVLPPLLGAAGALFATVWPLQMAAFCAGGL